jgi:hypothetical protein
MPVPSIVDLSIVSSADFFLYQSVYKLYIFQIFFGLIFVRCKSYSWHPITLLLFMSSSSPIIFHHPISIPSIILGSIIYGVKSCQTYVNILIHHNVVVKIILYLEGPKFKFCPRLRSLSSFHESCQTNAGTEP